MPNSFLLTSTSFNENHQPYIDIQTAGDFSRILLIDQELALEFDTSTKHCVGWYDYENKNSQICSDEAILDGKYEACIKCNRKTGFNPAFYNATTISDQQAKINQQPHSLYLAYFAPDVIKVGITQESRGIRRLLEQGARIAMILEAFPSANIARQYEEKISRQVNFSEAVSGNKKLQLLKLDFDPQAAKSRLNAAKDKIEQNLSLVFPKAMTIECNKYFCIDSINLTNAINMPKLTVIAGKIVAVVGSILITNYQSNLLAYNLKDFVGYQASKLSTVPDIDLPSEQLALF